MHEIDAQVFYQILFQSKNQNVKNNKYTMEKRL